MNQGFAYHFIIHCYFTSKNTLSMTTSALHFQQIVKSYNKKPALRQIDLTVRKGESFGLVGMNGAGKTTLLKCMLDFCDIESGKIEIFGVSHRITEARRPLAFLPERFMPPYYLTGSDFLKYTLTLQDISYNKADVAAMLEALDLNLAVLNKPVHTFSKGMTQKLGLASCFLARKKLYVLDEPMSGLDPKARALLKNRLQQLKSEGCTLFFSSHALADVEEICDRMAIMHEGQLRFVGTPAECRAEFQAATLEQAFLQCIA
jgi:ABC-2 type transport system ATP-binding protein